MSRILKLKRQAINESNLRLLNENTIDQDGITIGDITIHEGDVYDMPYVKSMGLKAYESGRPNSLSITLNLNDNVKNYESLLQSVLGYNSNDYGTQFASEWDEYKTTPNREDLMSMSNLPCTYTANGESPTPFIPSVTLSFTKQGDSINLTDVMSHGWVCRSAGCSPTQKEVNDCNTYMTELFKEGLGLPKKISELDPKFISLFKN